MISEDPEIAITLQTVANRLRARGYENLAFKIENLLELHEQELEKQFKQNKRN
jgi:hypothetical protein